MNKRADITRPLSGPITIGEFRARLAEMTDRVLAGEEVIVLRGTQPVARFGPIEPHRPKRLGTLNGLLSGSELQALDEAIETAVPEAEQRILEGDETDDLGIWIGPPRDRDADGDR